MVNLRLKPQYNESCAISKGSHMFEVEHCRPNLCLKVSTLIKSLSCMKKVNQIDATLNKSTLITKFLN